ncbi:MAG TPA: hypothetical protein VMT94_08020 [Burkholderiales bacterium]|nr:hypothetical protein [Burkholderiales bacterium]
MNYSANHYFRKMRHLVYLLLLLGNCGAIAAGSASDKLVGTWAWTRPANHCTETLIFRSDGSLSTTSDKEKTDNQYLLTDPSNAGGRYRLTIHVIKDYGGKDCVNSVADDTGRTNTVYLEFLTGTEMRMCYQPAAGTCFGPLHKVGE